MKIKKFVFYILEECCYVVWEDSGQCVIIDPGYKAEGESEKLHSFISSQGLVPRMVLLTHAHFDHIFGVRECAARYGIPVMMNPAETAVIGGFNAECGKMGLPLAESFDFTPLSRGQVLECGKCRIKALFTPGHSPGGVCFLFEDDKAIFTGDTLFAGSIGRTDNRWASLDDLMFSIHGTLMRLDGDIDVYPGHGPSTSIGRERATNPFIVTEAYSACEE